MRQLGGVPREKVQPYGKEGHPRHSLTRWSALVSLNIANLFSVTGMHGLTEKFQEHESRFQKHEKVDSEPFTIERIIPANSEQKEVHQSQVQVSYMDDHLVLDIDKRYFILKKWKVKKEMYNPNTEMGRDGEKKIRLKNVITGVQKSEDGGIALGAGGDNLIIDHDQTLNIIDTIQSSECTNDEFIITSNVKYKLRLQLLSWMGYQKSKLEGYKVPPEEGVSTLYWEEDKPIEPEFEPERDLAEEQRKKMRLTLLKLLRRFGPIPDVL